MRTGLAIVSILVSVECAIFAAILVKVGMPILLSVGAAIGIALLALLKTLAYPTENYLGNIEINN